jgi:hypothetical protein
MEELDEKGVAIPPGRMGIYVYLQGTTTNVLFLNLIVCLLISTLL